ncbi:MAG: L-threonylcarbamoyladenylate synthase [bacterium]|nr:L-threonylcarbamoyladenylate synthase [bacterium]
MDEKIIKILKKGGVGVLLTDTLYGMVSAAENKKAVERIYNIKGRNEKKPLIILISNVSDVERFGVNLDEEARELLGKFWPGAVSVILPCGLKKFEYLHRGTKTLAFRIPNKKSLIDIIKKTGSLVAPSANPEGLPPAKNITEAKRYFGDTVDFYQSGGNPKTKPSTIVSIIKGEVVIIRK